MESNPTGTVFVELIVELMGSKLAPATVRWQSRSYARHPETRARQRHAFVLLLPSPWNRRQFSVFGSF